MIYGIRDREGRIKIAKQTAPWSLQVTFFMKTSPVSNPYAYIITYVIILYFILYIIFHTFHI